MKRTFLLACIAFFTAGTALAQGETSIDLAVHFASGPKDPYEAAIGYGFGVNTDLKNLGLGISTPPGHKVQARISATNNDWHDDMLGLGVCLRRIPFFLGGRYLATVRDRVRVYGEIGPELSFDADERVVVVPGFGPVLTIDAETNLGVTPGVGIEFLAGGAIVGLNASYHLIEDPYWTAGFRFGYRLGD